MINTALVNPLTLPLIKLEDRRYLPRISAVYFVLDSEGTILYVGQSKDINQRWGSHHKYSQVREVENCCIAFMECDTAILGSVEAALIERFKPVLNGWGKSLNGIAPLRPTRSPGLRVRLTKEVGVPNLGVRIKEARKGDQRSLRAIAKTAGMSVTHWLKIEDHNIKSLPIETLRRIQNVLELNFGVEIDGEVVQ